MVVSPPLATTNQTLSLRHLLMPDLPFQMDKQENQSIASIFALLLCLLWGKVGKTVCSVR